MSEFHHLSGVSAMAKSEYVQFGGEVCEFLRNMGKRLDEIQTKRSRAFENRDDAEERINNETNDEAKNRAKEDHSDSIREIKMLSRAEKGARNAIFDAIKNGDQGTLFEGKINMTLGQLAALSERDDDEEKPSETRAVGRPGKKPAAEAPDPSKGDGVDEHLKASVKELGIRDQTESKLIDAGLTTVGRVAAVLDDDSKDIRDVLNCGENVAAEIKKAVSKYRKEHRKAALAAEGVGA